MVRGVWHAVLGTGTSALDHLAFDGRPAHLLERAGIGETTSHAQTGSR